MSCSLFSRPKNDLEAVLEANKFFTSDSCWSEETWAIMTILAPI